MRASFFVVMLISIPARANFLGGDDFNDNSVDPAKWGPDNTFQATISEQNGRVEFQSPASNADIAHRPWRLNFGSYNSNWSVLVDYSNTALASNGNRDVVGLQVYNSAMNGDSIAFHSLRSLNQNGYESQLFFANPATGTTFGSSLVPGSSTGSLRLDSTPRRK